MNEILSEYPQGFRIEKFVQYETQSAEMPRITVNNGILEIPTTHSSILAWRIPTDSGAWWVVVLPWTTSSSMGFWRLGTVDTSPPCSPAGVSGAEVGTTSASLGMVGRKAQAVSEVSPRRPGGSLSCYPLSSCLQCLPASGSFPMSQLFA